MVTPLPPYAPPKAVALDSKKEQEGERVWVEGLGVLQCGGLSLSGMFYLPIHQLSTPIPPVFGQVLSPLLSESPSSSGYGTMSKISCLPGRQKVRAGRDLMSPIPPASSLMSPHTCSDGVGGRGSFICSPVCTNLKSLIQFSVTVERSVVISLSITTLVPPTNDWCFSLVLTMWLPVGLGLGHQLVVA